MTLTPCQAEVEEKRVFIHYMQCMFLTDYRALNLPSCNRLSILISHHVLYVSITLQKCAREVRE